jgi:WG containing repeat
MKMNSCIAVLLSLALTSCHSRKVYAEDSNCESSKFQPLHLRSSTGKSYLYKFQNNGKWGMLNDFWETMLPPNFDQIDDLFEERFIIKGNDGKFGYLDLNGKIVIDTQFEEAMRFHENRAAVKLNGKWGYIDQRGHWVIAPKFDDADAFYEGRAFVRDLENKELLDDQVFRYKVIDLAGNPVTSSMFEEKSQFVDGTAIVLYLKSGVRKVGVLNRSGDLRELPNVEGVYPYRFSNGLWASRKVVQPNLDWTSINKILNSSDESYPSQKIGFVNRLGKFVVPPEFDDVGSFNYCVASVKVNGKWGLIDTKGKYMLKPQFEYIPIHIGSNLIRIQTENERIEADSIAVINGVPRKTKIVKYLTRFGVVNFQGELISPADKDFIGIISEGLIPFEANNKAGFMDAQGEIVIEPKFDSALSFSNSRAYVTIGADQGYIDRSGQFIWRSKK